MVIFVIIFLLLILVPDLYIWWMFIRHTAPVISIAWWLPAVFAIEAATAWAAGLHAEWLMKSFFIILLCLALPKLLFMLLSLVGLGIGHWFPAISAVIHILGVVAALLLCGCCIYGFTRGPQRLEVRTAEVASSRLPDTFDGYRIVHISDLHVGTLTHDSDLLQRLVAKVNSLEADAVVFTGDLVNASPNELLPHRQVLSQLTARDGVWSVLGNHDYCEYARYDRPDGAALNRAAVIRTQREMGWRILLNDGATIERDGEKIAVIGVENDGRPPFPSRGDLAKAKNGVDEGLFTILLSHDPTHWRRKVLPEEAADLTLSGHTHAMQFELFGLSPSALTYREWGGLYREGERMLYVSKGAGGTAPFRFGAWPEITVITLKKSR